MARSRESVWLALAGAFGTVGIGLLGISAAFGAASKGYSVWTSVPAILAYVMFGLAVGCLGCAAYDLPLPVPWHSPHVPPIPPETRSASWQIPDLAEQMSELDAVLARDRLPLHFTGRDEELRTIAAFCSGPDSCLWWHGTPWSGKTALMAYLVLHPPRGVRVVSFFVDSRVPGRADSNAFLDAMFRQLCFLTGRPAVTTVFSGERCGEFVRLLGEADDALSAQGQRLVVVIDGLDEDQGSEPSIASCLPRHPLGRAKIIVTSRLNPGALPGVPADHQLRFAATAQLSPSPEAQVTRDAALVELKSRLADQSGAEIIGFITASGGGLTAKDLAELSGRPASEDRIKAELHSHLARSLEETTWGEQEVFLLAHAELQAAASRELRNSLPGRRTEIRRWYERYKAAGWPAETPAYLLYPYAAHLASQEDLSDLALAATDAVRHDLMARRTGADRVALTEVTTLQRRLRGTPGADLRTLALLAVERARLRGRNTAVPVVLPSVIARLGAVNRAEDMARAIPDAADRSMALAELADVTAEDDHVRAVRLLREAVRDAVPVEPLSWGGVDPTARISRVIARTDPAWAEQLAASIRRSGTGLAVALSGVAAEISAADPRRSERLFEEAIAVASSTEWAWVGDNRAIALAEVAVALADADPVRSTLLAGQAVEWADTDDSTPERGIWRQVVMHAAKAVSRSDPGRAAEMVQALIGTLPDDDGSDNGLEVGARIAGLTSIAPVLAEFAPDWAEEISAQVFAVREDWAGDARVKIAETLAAYDPARAEDIAGMIADHRERATALASIAAAQASRDAPLARRLAEAAAQLAAGVSDTRDCDNAMARAATAVASSDPGSATQFLDAISDIDEQAESARLIANEIAVRNPAAATRVVSSIRSPGWRTVVLADLAEQFASIDPKRARRLADRAARLANRITARDERDTALGQAARALALIDPVSAHRIADSIEDQQERDQALSAVAAGLAPRDLAAATEAASAISNPVRHSFALRGMATALARQDPTQAEKIAQSIPNPQLKSEATFEIVKALAVSDTDRALAIAGTLTDPSYHRTAIVHVTLEVAGFALDRAEQIANTIPYQLDRATTLAELAVIAASVDPGTATRLANTAGRLAAQVSEQAWPPWGPQAVANILARSDPAAAEANTIFIRDPARKAETLAAIAGSARERDPARAQRLLRSAVEIALRVAEHDDSSSMLASAAVWAVAVDPAWARQIAATIRNPDEQATALSRIAQTFAEINLSWAQDMVKIIPNLALQAETWANIAEQAIKQGQKGRPFAEHALSEILSGDYWACAFSTLPLVELAASQAAADAIKQSRAIRMPIP